MRIAVARALDDAPVMRGDGGVDQVTPQPPKARQRAVFVGARQPAVADHVGNQNRCEFPGLAHRGPLRRGRDLLETTHCMQAAARRTSVQRDNFRDALLPLATAARIYRSRGGWNVPTVAGSMTSEAALLLFNSVRANVSTIYRISFACTQGWIETE